MSGRHSGLPQRKTRDVENVQKGASGGGPVGLWSPGIYSQRHAKVPRLSPPVMA